MSFMAFTDWVSRWQAALESCRAHGGEVGDLLIAEPARPGEVAMIEDALGRRIPESFRRVLLEFSSRVEFSWSLPQESRPPFRETRRGKCSWELSLLPEMARDHRGWIEHCFSDPGDPYDRVWHDKLCFLHVPNGDYIALDVSVPDDSPVVYLSHDDGEGHGYVLGRNFIDFVDRWSMLGCPGPEDWPMMPFLPSPSAGLDPDGENGRTWREWFYQ